MVDEADHGSLPTLSHTQSLLGINGYLRCAFFERYIVVLLIKENILRWKIIKKETQTVNDMLM